MRRTLLFCLMALCAITSAFAQTSKDVLAFRSKTAIASSTLMSSDVETVDAKPRFVMKVAGAAGTPMAFSVAGVENKLSVIIGDGEPKEYTVSTDITKLTPITINTTAENQSVVIEGDLLAINCKGNKLSAVDCSSSDKLVLLDCSENQLGQMDISALTSAKYVYLMNNSITNLITGELPLLEELNVSFNGLTSVNLANFPGLKALSVDNNKISSLSVEQNTKLEKLYCKSNKIQALDIAMLPGLKELSASGNRLTTIDLSKNEQLELLALKDNSLESINLGNNTKLTEINVNENKLKAIDLSKCTNLVELYCNTNELTKLDLAANKSLQTLSCGDNKLTTLNVEGMEELESMAAMYNELTSVDVKNCPTLMAVSLDHNMLNGLDFTGCSSLRLVDISINKFSTDNALKMIAILPELNEDDMGYIIYWNKEEYPDDEEGNEFDYSLYKKAGEKYWITMNGESEPLSVNNATIGGNAGNILAMAAGKLIIKGGYTDAQIVSATGQTMARLHGEREINLTQFADGIYIIKINANGKKSTAKFIVKR